MVERTQATRRAFVLSAVPAAAAVVVPTIAVAKASQSSPTSGATSPLAGLYVEWQAAIIAKDQAYEAEEAATQRACETEPDLPAGLKLTRKEVTWLAPLPPGHTIKVHGHFQSETFVFPTALWRKLAKIKKPDSPYSTYAKKQLSLAERYDRAKRTARRKSGIKSADEAATAAYDRLRDIEDAIIATTPTCRGDLEIKVSVIQRLIAHSEVEMYADDLKKFMADVCTFLELQRA